MRCICIGCKPDEYSQSEIRQYCGAAGLTFTAFGNLRGVFVHDLGRKSRSGLSWIHGLCNKNFICILDNSGNIRYIIACRRYQRSE